MRSRRKSSPICSLSAPPSSRLMSAVCASGCVAAGHCVQITTSVMAALHVCWSICASLKSSTVSFSSVCLAFTPCEPQRCRYWSVG
jgi:hypothetical protein